MAKAYQSRGSCPEQWAMGSESLRLEIAKFR
jgi:hypothetical protein